MTYLIGWIDNKSNPKLIKATVWHYVLKTDFAPRSGAYKLFGRLTPRIQWSIHIEEALQSVSLVNQTCVVHSLSYNTL